MFGQEVLIISLLSKFDNGVQDLKHERMIVSLFFCYLSLDNRFAPGLSFVTYVGNKEERPKLQQNLKEQSHFHALLTTYEVHGVFVT